MKTYFLETKGGEKWIVIAQSKLQATLLGATLYPNIPFVKIYVDKAPKTQDNGKSRNNTTKQRE